MNRVVEMMEAMPRPGGVVGRGGCRYTFSVPFAYAGAPLSTTNSALFGFGSSTYL